MKQVTLTHNPYLNKTEIMIGNELLSDINVLEKVQDKRLQYWIHDFFPLIDRFCFNGSMYELEFKGTETDFNDVKDYVALYAKQVTLKPYKSVKSEPVDKLKHLDELFEEAKKGPIEEFKGDEIVRAFDIAKNQEFRICVVATMSAGKSTLINAFLGEDLLPSKNEACTATITTIADYDEMKSFRGRRISEGKLDNWVPVDKSKLEGWNIGTVSSIEIQGDIPMIKLENVRLVVEDTPGPNNSGNPEHYKRTMQAISDDKCPPMVLYVLNGLQLETDDDNQLLKTVAKIMKQGGKLSQDRFMFVVSRMDGFDPSKENIISTMQKARTYLETKHGIANPNLYPVSALFTKLMRMNAKGIILTEFEQVEILKRRMFIKHEPWHMLQYMNVSPTVKRKVLERMSVAEKQNNDEELAMLHSGVPILEEVIQEYLNKYALPAKIYDARMSFDQILQKYDTINKLDEDLSNNSSRLAEINAKIEEIKLRQMKGEEASKFRDRVSHLEWKQSNQYNDKLWDVEKEFQNNILWLQQKAGQIDLTPSEATDKIEELNKQASQAITQTIVVLEEIIQLEVLSVLEDLSKEYNTYVKDLLGDLNALSPEISLGLNKSFQLQLDVKRLASKATVNRDVKESYSYKISAFSTWKFWTWGSTETGTRRVKKDFVNTKILFDEISIELRSAEQKNREAAQQETVEQVRKLKNKFLDQLSGIENKINEILTQIAEKTSSQKALIDAINANRNTKKWLEDFQTKLDSVLSIL